MFPTRTVIQAFVRVQVDGAERARWNGYRPHAFEEIEAAVLPPVSDTPELEAKSRLGTLRRIGLRSPARPVPR